jgi:hypothetical protein
VAVVLDTGVLFAPLTVTILDTATAVPRWSAMKASWSRRSR